MTRLLKVYIAGKISGNANYKAEFIRAELYIKQLSKQVEVINPIRQWPAFGIKKWLFYMIPAIRNVYRSDIIVFLPNWRQSKGARIERFFATLFLKYKIDL